VIRAVVFDLDDTLIDTTGQLVLPAHQEAAAAMIAVGLEASVRDVAEKRMDFAKAAPVEEIDLRVASFFGAKDVSAVAAAGHAAYFGRTVRSLSAWPFVGAALDGLAGRRRCLVTSGFEATQRKKIELAGLEAYFDAIEVVPVGEDKGPALARVVGAIAPEECVAIGDRLDREIQAARQLGMWAVRVAAGEGQYASPQNAWQRPHYTVPSVEALGAVIEDIEESGAAP
jgi:putative hydrolase of the HAD superfamily